MRILTLTSRDPANPALGGGETVVTEFAKALAARGHGVDLVCARFPGSAAEASLGGVRIHRVAPERALGPASYVAYHRRFRGRVDAVLEDFLGAAPFPFAAPLYAREPVVAVWHQDHVPIFREEYPAALLPALAGLERILLWIHRRSHLLVPSSASRASLLAKGAEPAQVRVFHPGIPEATLRAGPPPPARQREAQILCLGKIRRYKCQHHGILVLRELAQAVPRARLVIAGRVGDSDYLEEMRALARREGLEGRVSFEPGVTEDRKRELLRTSRVLLAPAPIEGFGIAIVEASACGLPVVGTLGVPEDALSEGVNGFRVPFGDIHAQAGRAAALLTDDALVDRLARSAREFVRPFTWERAAEPLMSLLQELEARRR